MDWSTLTASKATAGSLANWANNSTITSGAGGVADIILGEAVLWISERLRHWRMLSAPTTGTLTAVTVPSPTGQDTVSIPSDLLEMYEFYLTGTYYSKVPMKTEQEIIGAWNFDSSGNRVPSMPRGFFVNSANINFDSPPDRAYTYAYTYYQAIPALTSGAPTNWLTQRYPRLLRAACMIGICEWTKELGGGTYDRTYWMMMAGTHLDEAQMSSDRSRRATSGGVIYE
jgi:hypothetical protein